MLDTRRYVQQVLETELYVDVKIVDADDFSLLGRALSTISGEDISWRGIRSYMLSESAEVVADGGADGLTLRLTGYLRGRPMDLHSLMYIDGVGSCCVQNIRSIQEVFPSRKINAASVGADEPALFADPSRYVSVWRPLLN